MNRHRLLTSRYGSVALDLEAHALRVRAPEALGVDWGLGWWHGRWGVGAVEARRMWKARPAPRPGHGSLTFFEPWGFDLGARNEAASLSVAPKGPGRGLLRGLQRGLATALP